MEEPLPAGGSCLLGSIILPTFVNEDGIFDMERLENVVAKSVDALNDVLDEGIPLLPLEEQKISVSNWRQIGLGVLGVGDMLIKMGLRYGSEEAVKFCGDLAKRILNAALYRSAELAELKGVYPNYHKDAVLSSTFLLHGATMTTLAKVQKCGLRNSQLLTIAPTGSLGTMLSISTGIEPNFAFSYTRKTESLHGEDKYYKVYTKIAKDYMEKYDIAKEEDLPDFFVTAQNLNPYERIDMQSAFQEYIDASISSTINLVEETTVEEVEKLYMRAYEKGLKGMTVFRAGCARAGILTVSKPKEEKKEETNHECKCGGKCNSGLKRGELKPKAEDTIYYQRTMYIGCGKLKLMIGYSAKEKAIQDIYVIKSGSGGCEKNIQAVAIYMSAILRLGGDLFTMEDAIDGVSGCTSFATARARGCNVSKGSTCPSAILNILKDFCKEVEAGLEPAKVVKEEKPVKVDIKSTISCPECGEELEVAGGCYTCKSCGYSKCD